MLQILLESESLTQGLVEVLASVEEVENVLEDDGRADENGLLKGGRDGEAVGEPSECALWAIGGVGETRGLVKAVGSSREGCDNVGSELCRPELGWYSSAVPSLTEGSSRADLRWNE